MRERGLKRKRYSPCYNSVLSFPLRERGLKQELTDSYGEDAKSFPLRERGLKRKRYSPCYNSVFVVPLAGTWIETLSAWLVNHVA